MLNISTKDITQTLLPLGIGGIIGAFAKKQINPFIAGLGIDRFSKKIASSIIIVLGVYLMGQRGTTKKIGTGMVVTGSSILMTSIYDFLV